MEKVRELPVVHGLATESDWRPLIGQMSQVQKMVHLAARMDRQSRKEYERRLFEEGRETYRQTLQDELHRWGCPEQIALAPEKGPELKAIKDRAVWAARSISDTYNLFLARAILAIGEETPTANRHVYAHRLYGSSGWDSEYWRVKARLVAEIETMTMVNAGLADFYDRNGDLLTPEAEVIPLVAVCSICKAMVAGNPHKTIQAVYARYDIPPHPGCPHRPQVVADRKLKRDECQRLWAGR